MSGHSKWSTIKHKKGAVDAKRGKLFTKLIREVTVAAKSGGDDPAGNPRLRAAISAARAANMPSETVGRAIKRGTGDLEGQTYEDLVYEGYGPAGVAVIVESLTDNRNRTVSDLRNIFNKHNGNLGESGCVAWMFERRGVIAVAAEGLDEDEMTERALDAGADDVSQSGDHFEVICAYSELFQVEAALKDGGLTLASSVAAMVPQTTVMIEGRDAQLMMRLYDALEDHDDVQHVWANFDVADDVLEELAR